MQTESKLRVDVAFEDPVVFAGSHLSAIVTFRNIAVDENVVSVPRTKTVSTDWRHSSDIDNRGISAKLMMSLNPSNEPRRLRTMRAKSTTPSVHAESLLMGFIQLQGFFRVDSTVIDSEDLEHIKTQGVVTGRHGLGYANGGLHHGGFLKGLASGIGDLLGAGTDITEETSQLGPTESSDDYPVFSTPQSLLFVDLVLEPGQSKSFSYQIELPKTLPPSFRGRFMQIHYNMVVGAQIIQNESNPSPHVIFSPFRVFPFVDEKGQQTSYKFEEPIVYRTDSAIICPLKERHSGTKSTELFNQNRKKVVQDIGSTKGSQKEFKQYVSELMSKASDVSNNSIAEGFSLSARKSIVPGTSDLSARDNIDLISKYNHLHIPLKVNFDVAKNGLKIATVSLSRPIYRIGEEIVVVVDFSKSQNNIVCHHLTAGLESTESVNPEILIISSTRAEELGHRKFSQHLSSVFAAERVHVELSVPPTTTPQFTTSMVSYSWSVKLDFVITEVSKEMSGNPLLIGEMPDERGELFHATKSIDCETVSARIPLFVLPTNQDIGALNDYSLHNRRWVF